MLRLLKYLLISCFFYQTCFYAMEHFSQGKASKKEAEVYQMGDELFIDVSDGSKIPEGIIFTGECSYLCLKETTMSLENIHIEKDCIFVPPICKLVLLHCTVFGNVICTSETPVKVFLQGNTFIRGKIMNATVEI